MSTEAQRNHIAIMLRLFIHRTAGVWYWRVFVEKTTVAEGDALSFEEAEAAAGAAMRSVLEDEG